MKLTICALGTAVALAASGLAVPAQAEMTPAVRDMQQQWALINYRTPEGEQAKAMHELVGQCDAAAAPGAAESLIWCGIVRSTYAGMASPFSAMKYAKAARQDFENAIAIDPAALSGAAYTSLGTLYAKVPGWPLGFGDDHKAREYLLQGLEVDADGIDANYFYGEFLLEQGDAAAARDYLLRAQRAPARPDRPVADAGRQAEIAALLARAEEKLAR